MMTATTWTDRRKPPAFRRSLPNCFWNAVDPYISLLNKKKKATNNRRQMILKRLKVHGRRFAMHVGHGLDAVYRSAVRLASDSSPRTSPLARRSMPVFDARLMSSSSTSRKSANSIGGPHSRRLPCLPPRWGHVVGAKHWFWPNGRQMQDLRCQTCRGSV
jgi:hypothetical protein